MLAHPICIKTCPPISLVFLKKSKYRYTHSFFSFNTNKTIEFLKSFFVLRPPNKSC